MTKLSKIFWASLLVLVVLLGVAIAVIALNLDGIVKRAVETYGPQITKVSVTVDEVHISLFTASAQITNLAVGNPVGYTTPHAISVGDISVSLNPSSILSDKIVVRSVEIKSPEITFEGGLGGNNLSQILENVKGAQRTGGPTVTNSVGQPKPSKTFEVDDLVISSAKVNGSLKLFGSREFSINNLTLPDIHLTNLGAGSDGITATDLTKRVLDAITSATVKSVTAEASGLGTSVEKTGKNEAGNIKKSLLNLMGK
ncbi:MAG: AsmA family protein [Limisphaerales bacterium]